MSERGARNRHGSLALVGGAEFTEGCTFDAGLIAAAGATEVAVVPAAAAYEHPQRLLDRARSWFEPSGVTVRAVDVYRRADALDVAWADVVRGSRFVYLTDGSPMHLRSVLKDTPLWQAVVDEWRNGGVLAASGAAAAVLCDAMVDQRGGAYTVGLGLLSGITVIPRLNQWSEDKARRTIDLASAGLVVAGIEDRTALILDAAGEWRVEGAGRVSLHRDKSVVELASLTEVAEAFSR